MSAVISDCELFRYRLEREVQDAGIVFAYFGVNGSTAGPIENDQTVRKWIGFTERNGGRRFIVANAYGFRARDVGKLWVVDDPVGPDNDYHIDQVIADADILVPCWGSRDKLPPTLRPRLDWLREKLEFSAKPIRIFGLTASGDPKHPLILPYTTPLVPWETNNG